MTTDTAQQLDDHAIQILSNEGAQCGACSDEPGERACPDCEKARARYVAALRAAGWASKAEREALLAEIRRLRTELAEAREELCAAVGVSEALSRRLIEEQLAGSALYAALTMPTTPEQRQAALDKFTAVAQQVSAAARPAVVESHVVADDSSDPEHIDDCPGCLTP
jgi:hypothetical protein